MCPAERLQVDDFNNSRMGAKFDGMKAYALDKRRQVCGLLACHARPAYMAP